MNSAKIALVGILCTGVIGAITYAALDGENQDVVTITNGKGPLQSSPGAETTAAEIRLDPAVSIGRQVRDLHEQFRRMSEQQTEMTASVAKLTRLINTGVAQESHHDSFAQADDARASELAPEVAEEQFRQEMQNFDLEFADEQYDDQWSSDAEQTIAEKFDSEKLAGAHLVTAECRSTLCRLEISHPDLESVEEFAEEFMFALRWNADSQMMVVANDQNVGDVTTVMFVSRDGQPLPPLSAMN